MTLVQDLLVEARPRRSGFPHVWRVMRDFEPGTMLLVVANIKYDESDYIRDRTEFDRISKGWKGPSGSAGYSADARTAGQG